MTKQKHICPPDHKHADSLTCYTTHRCRCEECHDEWTERNRRRRKLIAYGRYQPHFVDATPAREHVASLQAEGMTLTAIARAAGLNHSTVVDLMHGRWDRADRDDKLTPTIHRTTECALLAVKASITLLSLRAPYDGRGMRRRLQALVARGWTLSAIGRQMDASPQRVEQLIKSDRTTAGTHLRVAALYEELWDKEPPSVTPAQRGAIVRSMNYARRQGWPPPAAWDDIDTDEAPPQVDRSVDIDWVAVQFVIDGQEGIRLTRSERQEVVKVLHARHWSDGLIADHVGCDERTILRDREDLDLEAFDQTELVRRDAA